jgi:hypothetical protein
MIITLSLLFVISAPINIVHQLPFMCLQCIEVQPFAGSSRPVLATCRDSSGSQFDYQLWDITDPSPVQVSPPPSTPAPPSIPSPPILSSSWVGKVVQLGNRGCLGVGEIYDGTVVRSLPCMTLPCETPTCQSSLNGQLWLVAEAGGGNVYLKEQQSGIGR